MPDISECEWNERQEALYTDRVHIWRLTRNKTSGVPTGDTPTLLYRNVPCKFEYTLNVDDPETVAAMKRKSALTTDTINLPIVGPDGTLYTLPNKAVFVNVTPNNPNYKNVSIAQGAANLLPGAGSRSHLNKQVVQVMTEEHPLAALIAGL